MNFLSDNGLAGSVDDTSMDMFPGVPAGIFGSTSHKYDPIHEYTKNGTVNGIKVAPEYRDRLIRRAEDLNDIFVPQHDVRVVCLDIRPGSEDLNEYQKILQDSANGDVVIQMHDKTASNTGYIVLLVYDKVRMIFRRESDNSVYPPISAKKE